MADIVIQGRSSDPDIKAGPPRAPLIALDSAPAARITELVSALPSVRAS